MNCPYCLTELQDQALVCKVCSRDVSLIRTMTSKIAQLEKELEAGIPAYEDRIALLEGRLEKYQKEKEAARGLTSNLIDLGIYLVIPLLLLLAAHSLVVVVYDTKLVYLRIISIILPFPFGYFLFKTRARILFPWFLAALFLAIASVIGMSAIVSLVDKTPIWPQNALEWKETLEFAASIAFSFLTGMLVGGMSYASLHRPKHITLSPFLKKILKLLGEEEISRKNLPRLIKKISDYGGIAITVGTTAVSIYTGLKDFL